MIDTKNYTLLDTMGFQSKSEAYDVIRMSYSHISGVTTYYDAGKWYIVVSHALR